MEERTLPSEPLPKSAVAAQGVAAPGAVSLAVSCLGLSWAFHLSIWQGLYVFYGTEAAYYLASPASWKPGVAVLLWSLVFAAILMPVSAAATWSTSKIVRRTGQTAFLLVLIFAVWKLSVVPLARASMALSASYGPPATYFLHLLAAATVFYLFAYLPDRTYRVARGIALAFSPFVAVSTVQLAVWLLIPSDLSSGVRSMESRQAEGAKTRVVWVLFDELDSALAFSADSPVRLPHFNQLRAQGFSHLGVEPSSLKTLTAIPELTTGLRTSAAEPEDQDTLRLTRGGSTVSWTSEETIFSWAALRGIRVGIAGWYHPYCRLFATEVSACEFQPMGSGAQLMRTNVVAAAMPLSEAVWLQSLQEWRLVGARVFLRGSASLSKAHSLEIPYVRSAQLEAFERLREAALDYAANPGLDFVFLHLPIPHPVGIFDREAGGYSLSESANYLDNLALADRTLGEIAAGIEDAGLADRTVLVVNSDHPVREFWSGFPFWSEDMERRVASRESLATPLFVRMPAVQPPHTKGVLEPWYSLTY